MPSKSRRSRRKQSFQGTQKKGKRISPVTVAQEQAVSPTESLVTPARRTTHPLSVPTPPVASHLHVATELRRIGILAGIMLAVLVVLAFTLP